MPAHDVELAVEPVDSVDARRLCAALDACLLGNYPPEGNFLTVATDEVSGDRGAFLVARLDGTAVGCSAVRRIGFDTAEIKRMYVSPDARGRGVGRAILAGLEGWAKLAGLMAVVLETGPLQSEAIGLYVKAGFTEIPCFNEYEGCEHSVCYGKRLV